MPSTNLANVQPVLRKTILDLDSRFFPSGIHPGTLTEISGAAGSGKTFLVTYLLARFLIQYPTKTALLIDTRGHFSYSNLISILQFVDHEAKPSTGTPDKEPENPPTHKLKLLSYLKRLSIIKCFDCDNLLNYFTAAVTTKSESSSLKSFLHQSVSSKEPKSKRARTSMNGHVGEQNSKPSCFTNICVNNTTSTSYADYVTTTPSPIEEKLLLDPDLSLLIVDSVDAFSHCPAFYKSEHCRNQQVFPNIMQLIKESVGSTRTPVVCTLTEYILPKTPLPSDHRGQTHESRPTTTTIVTEEVEHKRYMETAADTSQHQLEDDLMMDDNEDEDSQCSSNATSHNPPMQNIILEPKLFTHSITLTLLQNRQPAWNVEDLLARRKSAARLSNGQSSETQTPFTQVTNTSIETSVGRPNSSRETSGFKIENFNIPNSFECVAQYRALFSSRGSSSNSNSDYRVKFTIMSNMLFVIAR